MRLAYIDLCGFRGYRSPVHVELADEFTIVDGRNGVGKSTLFDAVEFALTGSLSKYRGEKAAGESVADYIWWAGDGPPPVDRYVEVGFIEGDQVFHVRRTQLAEVDAAKSVQLLEMLCDSSLAPASALEHLCAAAIIRDEHITTLSLDLKEADRYVLLRDTLGANNADEWIQRGAQLVALAKQRVLATQQDVLSANAEVSAVALVGLAAASAASAAAAAAAAGAAPAGESSIER